MLLLTAHGASAQKKRLHTVPCRNYAQVEAYFRYTPGCGTIVSGHRGGMAPGYPENCIETFENTLSHMPSFFEIDPQMTRDSVIVLMHAPDDRPHDDRQRKKYRTIPTKNATVQPRRPPGHGDPV